MEPNKRNYFLLVVVAAYFVLTIAYSIGKQCYKYDKQNAVSKIR